MPGIPGSASIAKKHFDTIRVAAFISVMQGLVDTFSRLEKRDEATLKNLTDAVLDSNIEQKRVAGLLGVSRTSIDRWRKGTNIPRSPAFRAWAVEELLKFARDEAVRVEEEGARGASERTRGAAERPPAGGKKSGRRAKVPAPV